MSGWVLLFPPSPPPSFSVSAYLLPRTWFLSNHSLPVGCKRAGRRRIPSTPDTTTTSLSIAGSVVVIVALLVAAENNNRLCRDQTRGWLLGHTCIRHPAAAAASATSVAAVLGSRAHKPAFVFFHKRICFPSRHCFLLVLSFLPPPFPLFRHLLPVPPLRWAGLFAWSGHGIGCKDAEVNGKVERRCRHQSSARPSCFASLLVLLAVVLLRARANTTDPRYALRCRRRAWGEPAIVLLHLGATGGGCFRCCGCGCAPANGAAIMGGRLLRRLAKPRVERLWRPLSRLQGAKGSWGV